VRGALDNEQCGAHGQGTGDDGDGNGIDSVVLGVISIWKEDERCEENQTCNDKENLYCATA